MCAGMSQQVRSERHASPKARFSGYLSIKLFSRVQLANLGMQRLHIDGRRGGYHVSRSENLGSSVLELRLQRHDLNWDGRQIARPTELLFGRPVILFA